MRASILFCLSSLCAAAVPARAAGLPLTPDFQTAAAPPAARAPADEVQAAISEVQVRGPRRHYRLDKEDARTVSGTYALSNGWTLRVTPRMNRVYAQINDRPPVELLAQSPDKFATADGRIATVFKLGPWGDDMAMSYVPGADLAERITVRSTIASR